MLRLFPALFLIVAACSQAPAIDRPGSSLTAAGGVPVIAPIDELVARARTTGVSDTIGRSVAARAARLRAKAAAMRGPVHDPATRARLAAAIAGRL